MSLSRRDFLKYGGATATAGALGAGVDMLPVEAAAVSLKIKEAKAFAGVCPYCAVGCGQLIYARDNKIIDIEGNPDTPHTLGRLCPKGAATIQLSNNPLRPTKALYRDVTVNRLEAIASLGSACIDNEECYLLSKLNRTFGIVYHEHQARV